MILKILDTLKNIWPFVCIGAFLIFLLMCLISSFPNLYRMFNAFFQIDKDISENKILNDDIRSYISKMGEKYCASKLIEFHEMNQRYDNNVIKIAVYDMPEENQHDFAADLIGLPTNINLNAIFIDESTKDYYLESIRQNGKTIYKSEIAS